MWVWTPQIISPSPARTRGSAPIGVGGLQIKASGWPPSNSTGGTEQDPGCHTLQPLGPAPGCFPHPPSLTQGAQASRLPSPSLSHLIFPNERQEDGGELGHQGRGCL